ncbi:hypothetical protein [Kocuria sp.]|uniref:hypothetical protein n=1 Tax=Kocuria sp. TaxID=1871328 RepID=UPI0026DAB6CB|nr:hypothetical protein [Kocuria sp.]MDO4918932.1 hypothetical protein [Kocuria sp.]
MEHLSILLGALLVLLLAAGVVYFLVSVARAAWRPREGAANYRSRPRADRRGRERGD